MKRFAFRSLWVKLALLVVVAMGLELATAQGVEVLEETDAYRLVAYEGETYRVPQNPERIVVLGYRAPDNLLALGLQPVGMGTEEDGQFPPHLASRLDGVTPVGSWFEPNLEAVLTLEPDFIIAELETHRDMLPQLKAITPNVLLVPEYNPSGQGASRGRANH